jgi:hypothetical protein
VVLDGDTGGTAQLSLVGPVSFGAANYKLARVEFCMEAYGYVDEASIIGLGAPGVSIETKDTTDRTVDGCYTIVPDAATAGRKAFHLMLYVVGEVHIQQVLATWSPA